MIASWHRTASRADYETRRLNDISREEGVRPYSYIDTKGIPSIGIGFNLHDPTVRDAVFQAMKIDITLIPVANSAARAAEQRYITQLTNTLIQFYADTSANEASLQRALDNIMIVRGLDPLLSGFPHIAGRFAFRMEPTEIQNVFNGLVDRVYENRVDAWLPGIPESNERLALVSLAFNGLIGAAKDKNGNIRYASPALRKAILDDNRAEAWYEIRYNSNDKAGTYTNRRYREADLFGLYGGTNQPATEEEAIDILRMLRKHQDTIDDYEGNHPVPAGSQYLRLQLQPTYGFLIARFNLGGSLEQVLVSLNVLGGDPIQGTDASELLLGDVGHDILVGGAGDDLLIGGAGADLYVIHEGDGHDTIFDQPQDISGDGELDGDGLGVVELAGRLLQGGLKASGESQYTTLEEDPTQRITYQWGGAGSDLTVTHNGQTVNIKNFSNGQLGIQLTEGPAVLKKDPPLPQATSTDYKKIDHYEQVGTNPVTGAPIYQAVYVPFFDDASNNTLNTAEIGGLTEPIGDENNLIYAKGGNDYVKTGEGKDQVYGEAGQDRVLERMAA